MSFGFSVGDIVMVSHLAYKLYSSVTGGRRSATKDLKELENVLFGVHCALDHLGKAAKDISVTVANRQDGIAAEMRQKLDSMINSCGATLQELDSVTKKYREAANPDGRDVVDEAADLPTMGTSTNQKKKPQFVQFKNSVRVNWWKMRWDIERKSLGEYREKLQAHTDAINIVLSTFLWSTTNRIEVDGKFNAEKMHDLQNQALQSNTSLLQLVQEIHTLLRDPKGAPSPPPVPPPKPPSHRKRTLQTGRLAPAVPGIGGLHDRSIQTVNPHFVSHPLMAAIRPGPMAMRLAPPQNSRDANHHPDSTHETEKETQPSKLPRALVLLNEKRRVTGSKEFKEFQRKHHLPEPPPKPSFLTIEIPSVPQLQSGLAYIFRPFPPAGPRQATVNREERKEEIVRWTQGLDHLLVFWIAEPLSSPPNSREAKQAKVNEVVDLLTGLNTVIEESDDKMKRVFYQGTEQAGFGEVLNKLQTVSKSVRGMKEIEEFEDVREEWKDSQQYG